MINFSRASPLVRYHFVDSWAVDRSSGLPTFADKSNRESNRTVLLLDSIHCLPRVGVVTMFFPRRTSSRVGIGDTTDQGTNTRVGI
jgi:hypothetical protein